jgi:hypothetical protein
VMKNLPKYHVTSVNLSSSRMTPRRCERSDTCACMQLQVRISSFQGEI